MDWNQNRILRSLRTSIQNELPVGSSYDETLAFLNKHRIAHGVLIEEDRGMPELNNTLDAGVDNPVRCLFVSKGIEVRFRFSKDRRLEGVSLTQSGEAP